MRSSVINTTTLDKREYVLLKNRREELDVIPTNFITEYYPKKDDVSTLTIEIPSHVRKGGQLFEYPLYHQMQPKRHILVKIEGEVVEHFLVEDINISEGKEHSTKTITAYGYDFTLKTKSCLIGEGLTRQLYLTEDEEVHVGEGILNIFEEQTGWKVNHIDELAMKEQVTENVTVTKELMGAKTYEKVEDNMVLFEKDFTVPSEENFPLNFDIAWLDLVVTTTDGFKYESGSIIHTFTDYPTGVTKIKATFTSDSTQRYGITYEITLDNGETSKVTYAFTNCRKLKLETKGINLTYQTSQEEEKMATKYRYLEHSQSYWYQYLKTTVQEAFGVYIRFNTHNKTIDVFNEEQFGQWKGFHLDFDNLLSKINKQPNMSELCTRLWIQSNSVDITEVNPLGTSYLEDYSYFEQSGTMSESLSSALKRYYAHVEVKQVEWLEVSKLKNSTDQWLTKRNSELTSLNEQVKAKQAILTAYLKDKDKEEGQKRVAQELKELEEQVSQKLSQIETLKAQSDEYLSQMQLIGKQMAKETSEDSQGKIFTNVDLEELDDITIEQTYTDDYYTKAKGLFEYGKTLMKDKATLRYTFTLEHKDLAQNIKHPLGWEWFIELGAKVEIADKDIANKDGFITIYAYKYSPKTKQMTSVEFDNNSAVIKAVSGIASFSKIAHNTANMTDFWKHTWVEADKATAIVSDIRKNGLDLAANMVRGGNTVNKISMTESGVFVIDAENEDNQVYIGASLIAITDDRWITSKTAIDKNGLISDTLVGKLILSEKLFISNEDGSFEILPNGLTIRDELGKEQVSLGIDDKKNPFLHLGIKDESKNHLIFNADGTLDIKASSIKLMTGDVVSKEEMEEIANNVANKVDLAIRNYALDTVMHKTLTGNGNNEQVISLYELSQDGTTFMDKEVTLTFKYTTTLESQGSFFVRTGSNHYQALTDVIVIGSETRQGKVVKTVTITKEAGQSFSDLELVARNFTGEITISMLKFSLGNKATDWTPAPEDSDASYSVILTNESQVIPTTTSLKPLSNSQYTTQVIVYQGTKQQTNFKIKPLVAKDGITPSINGDTITFSVNKNTILSANQGQFEIQIEIDKKVFKKMWTWAVASQGQDGGTGESAKYVVLSGEQIFRYPNGYDSDPSPYAITLVANTHGFENPTYKWYCKANGEWREMPQATTDTLIINHNDSFIFHEDIRSVQIKCTVSDLASDEMTIIKLADGFQGEDGYSIILTNESHSFPCESDGSFLSDVSTYSQIIVYKGQEERMGLVNIGDIDVPSGMSIKIIENESNAYLIDERTNSIVDELEINITSEGGLWIEFTALSNVDNFLSDTGSVTIPITVDDITFYKVFSWSKAKKGEQGETAKSIDIVATSQVFKSENGKTFTPDTITLTPILQNLDYVGWKYSNNGGVKWYDVDVSTEGVSFNGNNLIISNNTPLFTAKNSTLTLKVISNDIQYYDTITLSKLCDGTLGEIEIGVRNWLAKTGEKVQIFGSGLSNQIKHLYYLVNKQSSPLMGEEITFSCDYKTTSGSYGSICFETNEEFSSPSTKPYHIEFGEMIDINEYPNGRMTHTLQLTEDNSYGFTGVQLRLENVVGEIVISNCIITIGNVPVGWSPAPEDGIDFTNEAIDELRKTDIKQIIDKNQESLDRIDQILNDSVITISEKKDILYDFERATIAKDSAINYYNAVNDTSMYNLKVTMEETYSELKEVLAPILQNMTTDYEGNLEDIRGNFKGFYVAHENLVSALQKSVAILLTTHSTKLEQLRDSITLTASKTEIMQDKVNQFDAHMKFSADGFVEIFATENGKRGRFSTQITNKKLSFKDNDVEVAYVSNQELNINKAVINDTMKIGNFSIKPSGTPTGGIVFAFEMGG